MNQPILGFGPGTPWLTPQKGAHSFKYFLSQMCTPVSIEMHIYAFCLMQISGYNHLKLQQHLGLISIVFGVRIWGESTRISVRPFVV